MSTNAKGAAAKKQRVIKPIASGSGGGVGYGAGGVDMGVGYPGGQHTSTECVYIFFISIEKMKGALIRFLFLTVSDTWR